MFGKERQVNGRINNTHSFYPSSSLNMAHINSSIHSSSSSPPPPSPPPPPPPPAFTSSTTSPVISPPPPLPPPSPPVVISTDASVGRKLSFLDKPFICTCCNIGLTYRDVALLVPCILWTIVCITNFSYIIAHHVIKNRYPPSMPLFWALISCHFSSNASLLIVSYHTDEVERKGLPQDTIDNLRILNVFTTLLGLILFITICVSGAVFVIQCTSANYCETGSFLLNIVWFVTTLGWLVVLGCLTPRQKYLNKLVSKYEERIAAQRRRNNIYTYGYTSYPSNSSYFCNGNNNNNNHHIQLHSNANNETYPSPYVYGNPTS